MHKRLWGMGRRLMFVGVLGTGMGMGMSTLAAADEPAAKPSANQAANKLEQLVKALETTEVEVQQLDANWLNFTRDCRREIFEAEERLRLFDYTTSLYIDLEMSRIRALHAAVLEGRSKLTELKANLAPNHPQIVQGEAIQKANEKELNELRGAQDEYQKKMAALRIEARLALANAEDRLIMLQRQAELRHRLAVARREALATRLLQAQGLWPEGGTPADPRLGEIEKKLDVLLQGLKEKAAKDNKPLPPK